jgi:hypothetical protein
MDIDSLLKLSAQIKEHSGVTPIYEPQLKKAHALLKDKCPRCNNGDITTQDDKLGRLYCCNLCEWSGWVPLRFIEIVDDETIALALVKFCL